MPEKGKEDAGRSGNEARLVPASLNSVFSCSGIRCTLASSNA